MNKSAWLKTLAVAMTWLLFASTVGAGDVPGRWPAEKANQWYAEQPWLVGCNFLPSTAVNDVEMWQAESFDAATIDRELGWAHELGFNTVRVFINYVVWEADAAGLKKRFAQFLAIAGKHGIRVMPVLLDDCNFAGRAAAVGKQPEPVPGVHNSQWVSSPPLKMVDDKAAWPRLERYVKDVVGTFANDKRVVIWDPYNEPGNSNMGAKSLPLLEAVCAWVRETKPTQPLTIGAWLNFNTPMQQRMLELSDLISFHGYDDPKGIEAKLKICGGYGRPVLCTEWLCRQAGNNVEPLLKLFKDRKIGCYNWGLVAGRTQTYFHWGSQEGTPEPAVWQHDILRQDGKPYSELEVAAIANDTKIPGNIVMPKNPPADWLTFHLVHPGPGRAVPGDPNCAFFWKGRYHLHYIYNDNGFNFAHVSSADMVHWTWHPTTLTPQTMGHGMFSGTGFLTKEGKPAIIYHGFGSRRNQIAIAEDDQLEKWSKPRALEPVIRPGQNGSLIANWDPDAWIDGENYYALSGGTPGSGKPATLFKSGDRKNWEFLGLFMDQDMPDVGKNEDISCPNFFRIGNKWMLLCISHNRGCRYYLGQWQGEKFIPESHARMSWNNKSFFAPESVLTPDGRRVMWAWLLDVPAKPSGIQSLPRELELPADGILRIRPLRELAALRYDEQKRGGQVVKSGTASSLDGFGGDAIEIKAVFSPDAAASEFGVEVMCGKDGGNGVRVAVSPGSRTLKVGKETAPFELKRGEELTLRIFVDKNLVEVFANDRQAAIFAAPYARDNTAVRLFSDGGDSVVQDVKRWKIKSVYGK